MECCLEKAFLTQSCWVSLSISTLSLPFYICALGLPQPLPRLLPRSTPTVTLAFIITKPTTSTIRFTTQSRNKMCATIFRFIKIVITLAVRSFLALLTIDFLLYQYATSPYNVCESVQTIQSSLCMECAGTVFCSLERQQDHVDLLWKKIEEEQQKTLECKWDCQGKKPGGRSYGELKASREERHRARQEKEIDAENLNGGLGGEVGVNNKKVEISGEDQDLRGSGSMLALLEQVSGSLKMAWGHGMRSKGLVDVGSAEGI